MRVNSTRDVAVTIMTRMTFFNLGPDNVRQLGENSNDDGKTWAAVWDATYTRKKVTEPRPGVARRR